MKISASIYKYVLTAFIVLFLALTTRPRLLAFRIEFIYLILAIVEPFFLFFTLQGLA